MFERFQTFLQSLTSSRSATGLSEHDPLIAVAALCIQVMEADGTVSKSEHVRLRASLRQHYGINGDQLEAVIAAGERQGNEAVDYFRFTSTLKRHLDQDQRLELIGILWEIVYADGVRSEMEDHVIWRIADLLGVSGNDRVAMRQQAASRAPGSDLEDHDA